MLLSRYPTLYCLTTCDQMRVCFPDALMAKMEKCGMTVWLSGFVTDAVAVPRVGSLMDLCQPKGGWGGEGSSGLPWALSSVPSWLTFFFFFFK